MEVFEVVLFFSTSRTCQSYLASPPRNRLDRKAELEVSGRSIGSRPITVLLSRICRDGVQTAPPKLTSTKVKKVGSRLNHYRIVAVIPLADKRFSPSSTSVSHSLKPRFFTFG